MTGIHADAGASHTAPVANGPLDRTSVAPAASSTLSGRTQLGTNPGPRVGFLGKIANLLRRCFGRASAAREVGTARMTSPKPLASRERLEVNFTQKLCAIGDALTSTKATSETMLHALLAADDAAVELDPAAGSALAERTFQGLCESASPTQLNRLALAFNSRELSEAADQLTEHPAAAQALVVLQRTLNQELSRRAEANVAAEIAAAVSVMESGGGPAERVTEHLRLAFAAAVPLVNRGIVAPSAPTNQFVSGSDLERADQAVRKSILDQTDRTVRELILDQLERQPPDTCRSLLAHLSQEHLKILSNDAQDSGRLIERRLRDETQQRPEQMFADLQRSAASVLQKCNSGGALDRPAFMSELSSIANAVRALQKHQGDLGIAIPPELAELKKSIAAALERTISSKKLDPETLTAADIATIQATFNSLGAHKTGGNLLAGAQDKVIAHCTGAYQQSLHRLGSLLTANQPEELLKELGRFAEAESAMTDVASTFASSSRRMNIRAIMNDVVSQWLNGLSESELNDLQVALAGPNFAPLVDALHKGQMLALNSKNSKLANQLHAMLAALGELALSIKPRVGHVEATPSALPNSTRQALGKLYGINLDTLSAKLNAGRFNAQQTHDAASLIERPASSAEQRMVKLGGREIASQFVEDQRRTTPVIQIETGAGIQPLLNYDNWPDENRMKGDGTVPVGELVRAEQDVRVLDGYEHLVGFCGGNVEEARTLSLYLQHGEFAGLAAALALDSPLQLDDGTTGTIDLNPFGGGQDSSQVTLSRGPNGHPQLDVSIRYDGRNVFKPADGAEPLYLSADSSATLHYRAELVDGALKLLAPPSYTFVLKRDDFQQPYEPPTSAAIRRMNSDGNGLAEILDHSTRLGTDNQVKALRAADDFQREPTLLNAVEVISECDRDPATAAFVPQGARDAVKHAMDTWKRGILVAFAHAKELAETHVKTGDPTAVGSRAASAQQFLAELEALEQKSGAALIKDAEKLHRDYIPKTQAGASQQEAPHLFPGNFSDPIDTHLRAARKEAQRQAFSADLFGELAEKLAQHFDAEVSPVLIDAIKRGEP